MICGVHLVHFAPCGGAGGGGGAAGGGTGSVGCVAAPQRVTGYASTKHLPGSSLWPLPLQTGSSAGALVRCLDESGALIGQRSI